jgi:hypothetical protein
MAKNFWDLMGSMLLAAVFFILIYILVITSWDVTKEAKLAAIVTIVVGFGIFIAKWISNHKKEELGKKADVVDLESQKLILSNHIKEDDERYHIHRKSDDDRYDEMKAIIEQSLHLAKEGRETVVRIEQWILTGQITKKAYK